MLLQQLIKSGFTRACAIRFSSSRTIETNLTNSMTDAQDYVGHQDFPDFNIPNQYQCIYD
jgi:hypothetical protein